jgi:hypothetical protein
MWVKLKRAVLVTVGEFELFMVIIAPLDSYGHSFPVAVERFCKRRYAVKSVQLMGLFIHSVLSLDYKPAQRIGCAFTAVIIFRSGSVVRSTGSRHAYGSKLWRSFEHLTSGATLRSSHEKPALNNLSKAVTKDIPGETVRATNAWNFSLSLTFIPGQPASIITLNPMSGVAQAIGRMRDFRAVDLMI